MYCHQRSQCANLCTTPIRQWGFRQCLHFCWTTLRGKHCQHPIAIMVVVDTFRQRMFFQSNFELVFMALGHILPDLILGNCVQKCISWILPIISNEPFMTQDELRTWKIVLRALQILPIGPMVCATPIMVTGVRNGAISNVRWGLLSDCYRNVPLSNVDFFGNHNGVCRYIEAMPRTNSKI